ncbi:hypothetical protein ACYQR9_09005 [Methylobacterium sp. CM6241]
MTFFSPALMGRAASFGNGTADVADMGESSKFFYFQAFAGLAFIISETWALRRRSQSLKSWRALVLPLTETRAIDATSRHDFAQE